MSLNKLEKRLLAFFQDNPDQSFSANDLAQRFNFKGSKNYKRMVKALAFLEHIEVIELKDQASFQLVQKSKQLVQGKFRANAKGYGFVTVEEGRPDLFIPPGKTGEAMDGDDVEIRILKEVNPETGKGSEAEVLGVLHRAVSQLVGEFFTFNQKERQDIGYIGYLLPRTESTQALRIMIEDRGLHPVSNTICVAEISQYPSSEQPSLMIGHVTKELGHRDEPGVDILEILYQFGIPHEFPEDVKEEVKAFPDQVDSNQMDGRRDLRDQLIFTIDGADAKDLDDAISIQKAEDGTYQLGVHIADVSHYVQAGTAIDAEAYDRGTSVYLTDRVVPMLPQKLSNGLCSLHAHEDRLTLTCQMTIDSRGKVIKSEIFPSVINSTYRMTYKDVNGILDGDSQLRQDYADLVEYLEEAAKLHKILEKKRDRRGAINFDSKEAEIIVDRQGHPQDIVLRQRGLGERLIESFMLVANETVAGQFMAKELPFVYRIHEQPDEEKMQRFAEFASTLGLVLRGNPDHIKPKQLQEVLEKAEGEDFESVLSMMMLRSMQQAKYSDEALGHYGLATQEYTHFTSPIRRYPDLMVHRLIHFYWGRPSQKDIAKVGRDLAGITDHASKMERRAVEAERETDALKKAEYMVDKVGQEYPGQISSLTSFGMFVELDNTVEGLITMDRLSDDYYQYIQDHMLLIGERTGKVFKIGQKVLIKVEAVDVSQREIDFSLVDFEPVKENADLQSLAQTKKNRRQKSGGRKGSSKSSSKRSSNQASKRGSKTSGSKQRKSKRQSKSTKQKRTSKSQETKRPNPDKTTSKKGKFSKQFTIKRGKS